MFLGKLVPARYLNSVQNSYEVNLNVLFINIQRFIYKFQGTGIVTDYNHKF